jgi:hypothetical protein
MHRLLNSQLLVFCSQTIFSHFFAIERERTYKWVLPFWSIMPWESSHIHFILFFINYIFSYFFKNSKAIFNDMQKSVSAKDWQWNRETTIFKFKSFLQSFLFFNFKGIVAKGIIVGSILITGNCTKTVIFFNLFNLFFFMRRINRMYVLFKQLFNELVCSLM